ncbi:uncharacterized protein [Arachis hypogaea]|uniref:uncharacterized protein isoform X2 n=1 Tax=Arachis hypogaea TaxID=3818 RepID=UPI003B224950
MASSPSPWLGSHPREPSLSAPPSGLPPLLPPGNAAAVVDNAAATVTGVLITVGARRSRCGFVPPLSLDFRMSFGLLVISYRI